VSYARPVDALRRDGRPINNLVEYFQRALGGFLPTEVRGALQAKPFHTGAQFVIQ
jgi:hypothetical protein